ncbi:translation elongation factor 4 [Desulfomonile tiedjei]|uniref:Elongation factor 4 n=1 Tax=Desulfomonile tiedjei (strain ATCC 49306 / DSM 6799 / DCB-1) TaxID=706587 RepID=I4C2J0_DESTA|nr:translation elongation factor 4 [Desulfomonile tiedjei]AFM23781.1 GTP-binding protein LepA [Desulfomonile tiedjei DSM 6799]
MDNIRNFSIIAHIDHGKSTLADRLLQITGVVGDHEFRDQMLDTMDIERERGITIKSQSVALPYRASDGKDYVLNLIDTPGHADFSYEVSRALVACEGALLVIDAAQGVQAQTLANFYMALELDLEVIPVINKIDLPSADVDRVKAQIEKDLGLDSDHALAISAKEGTGIEEVLEAVVNRIPHPKGDPNAPLKALIFDSHWDPYRGTIVHLRLFDGKLKPGEVIKFWSNNATYKVEEIGSFLIERKPRKELNAGQVGYMIAGIKTVSDTRIGDTVTLEDRPCKEALKGFKLVKPVVFSSFYPISSDDYEELAVALEKLKLNDASLTFEKDHSTALGHGFRCGFLGLLHLEIVQERLEREFNLSLILTAPSVQYVLVLKDGTETIIDNPAKYPDPVYIQSAKEPFIRASIILPDQFLGPVISLSIDRRGVQKDMHYLDSSRVELTFDLPLSEVLFDFYDRLKSVSRGYASFDYDFLEYRETELAKVDILVSGEKVDALSMLVHKDRAYQRARRACERLKNEIPRQLFKVAVQGAIGGKIIARETVSALRKDVTAKCYGGDITRKKKLLEKQKEGKKRMKQVGNVVIPQSAFLAVLKTDEDE